MTKEPEFIISPLTLHVASDGTVDGMDMTTGGISAQKSAFNNLTEKFGTPTKRVDGKFQNLAGASFDTITAFWVAPGYEVDFVGVTGRYDQGDIAVSTSALHDTARRAIESQKVPF